MTAVLTPFPACGLGVRLRAAPIMLVAQGLSGPFYRFARRSRFGMNKFFESIIGQGLEDARAKGEDNIRPTRLAVRAARQARPAMMASDAPATVNLVWRS